MLIIDIFQSLLRLKLIYALPIHRLGMLDSLHDIGNSYGFLPDHDGELVGIEVLLIVDPKHLIPEDCLVVFVTEDDVRSHVVETVFVDGFEDSWVEEGYHVLWLGIR